VVSSAISGGPRTIYVSKRVILIDERVLKRADTPNTPESRCTAGKRGGGRGAEKDLGGYRDEDRGASDILSPSCRAAYNQEGGHRDSCTDSPKVSNIAKLMDEREYRDEMICLRLS